MRELERHISVEEELLRNPSRQNTGGFNEFARPKMEQQVKCLVQKANYHEKTIKSVLVVSEKASLI